MTLMVALCAFTRETVRYQYEEIALVGEEKSKHISEAYTSNSYRYSAQFNRILQNNRYASFSEMYQADKSTAIPGLANTDVLGNNCKGMVPQGICVTKDYMIISAYDSGKRGASRVRNKQNSVLYILSNHDAEKRQYLTTVVLPDVNHVGGLAFDGKYLWIAKSTTNTCSAISIKEIDKAVASGQNSVSLDYTATVDCGMTASFLTYYDHRLWVGSFAAKNRKVGKLSSFSIGEWDDTITLTRVNSVDIPYHANGVAIKKIDNRVCMTVISSYSRMRDTTVYLYELQDDDMPYIAKKYKGEYKFPPMGEEVAFDGKDAYFLFESAASCYSYEKGNKCVNPVDRVCAIELEELFAWTGESELGEDGVELTKSWRLVFQQEIIENWAALFEEEKYLEEKEQIETKNGIKKNDTNISLYKNVETKTDQIDRKRGPTIRHVKGNGAV